MRLLPKSRDPARSDRSEQAFKPVCCTVVDGLWQATLTETRVPLLGGLRHPVPIHWRLPRMVGKKKRKVITSKAKAQYLVEWVSAYQYALRALFRSLPAGYQPVPTWKRDVTPVGRVDIWPCRDGAVIL